MTETNPVGTTIRDSVWGGVRRLVTPAVVVSGLVALSALAAGAGYISRSDEVNRLDRQLTELTSEVGKTGQALDSATTRVLEMSTETTDLRTQVSEKDVQIAEITERLTTVEEIAAGSIGLETSFTALTDSYRALQDDYRELEDQLVVWEPIVEIETFGPNGNPLLLNKGLDAWVTEPVCTGSMEPAITCDDLMVVYPPRFTDLDVGDIIIFWRQNSICTGYVEGAQIVHRITRVTSSPGEGLAFETKGDSNTRADPCTVPVTDVTAKVLAVIHDARSPD
ncbi:MAG: signal peptidase I [Dehalococcoidia bacterium]|nr:signal peptidase I [Dehalococcoidia bacterium]